MSKIDRPVLQGQLLPELKGRTLYISAPTQFVSEATRIPEDWYDKLKPLPPEPQVNPNELLHNMLDHIHDGNREELVGELILMLGWLHKGGTMPNISKDTVTSTTLWIIPQND